MPSREVITSLTGTVAPLLTVDTADEQRLDYNSLWQPRQWKKSTPFVRDDMEIQPNGQSNLSIPMDFEVPKLATQISTMVLRSVYPPSTIAPLGNPAFIADHIGFAQVDYFRINFGSNQVYTREAQDLYFKYRKALGVEKTRATNMMVLGDATLAQRQNFLQNGGELLTDLNLPFTTHQSMSLPIIVLSQKTRFSYKSKALSQITTAPVAGTTITPTAPVNFTLRITAIHPTGDEGSYLLKMSQESDGIAYMIHQNVRQNSDDFSTTQNGAVLQAKLSAMTKPLKSLYWALIPTKLQNDTGRNDIFMYSPNPIPTPPGMSLYNPVQSWRIEANGLVIQRDIETNYNQVYQHSLYHESVPDDQIFFQTYSEYPHSVNAACGYLDYTNLNNPVLHIRMGNGGTGPDPDNPLLPQTLRLVVNSEDYNFWFFKSGNWSRSFN
jgi:hypothetical protein